jgi:hypothetical protein
MNQKYQINPNDLISLRTCLVVMLDKCEDAIRANKPLPISEELYSRLKETEVSTKYSNLKLTNDNL